jgi:hypothetical protein
MLQRRCFGSLLALAVAILALAPACSTPTKMSNVWRDPSYTGGPMRNIVVFGGRLSETDRRTLEDGFVAALQAHGVHATPSYSLFPGTLPSRDEARAKVQQAGFEGTLVSTLKGVNEKPTFVEGAAPGFWDGYYGPAWGSAYGPGYVVTEPVVRFESSLWSMEGDSRMIWSALTQTDNPTSTKNFVSSLTNDVVPALTKAGLIAPAGGNPITLAVPKSPAP